MKTWSLGKKLYTGFGLLALSVIALGIAAISGTRSMNSSMETVVSVTAKKLELAGLVREYALHIESEQRAELMAALAADKPSLQEAVRARAPTSTRSRKAWPISSRSSIPRKDDRRAARWARWPLTGRRPRSRFPA